MTWALQLAIYVVVSQIWSCPCLSKQAAGAFATNGALVAPAEE